MEAIQPEMARLSDLFPSILASVIGALALSPLVLSFAQRKRIIDLPGSAPHKRHSAPTPLGGGIVFLVVLVLVVFALQSPIEREVAGILVAAAFITAWGLIDDVKGMRAWGKLLGQLAAAAIVMMFGIQVRLTNLTLVNYGLTLIWLVGLMNAFNFVDSMDGLALGLGGIASAFFMLVTIDSQQPSLARLSAVIVGITFGVYFYNATPSKMFLGDSGSQLLGLLMGSVGIAYNPIGLSEAVSWFTPILVLGVPIFDSALVIVSRLRGSRPIYQAAHDHTYHRLLSSGLDPTRAVFAMQLVAIALGLIAFMTLRTSILAANFIWGAVIFSGIAALLVLEKRAAPSIAERS